MNNINDNDDQLPMHDSKSQRKRDMIELQKLGETLVNLSAGDLAKIPLDERLAHAITEARALTNHGAKRRQLQYIGRIMRDTDPTPIKEAIEKIQGKHQQNNALFHQLEKWRDKLIAEGDTALQEFLKQYPHTELQRLRQLIRNAKNDLTTGKNSGAAKELFRALRDVTQKE